MKDHKTIKWRRELKKLKSMKKNPDTDPIDLSVQELRVARFQREAGK